MTLKKFRLALVGVLLLITGCTGIPKGLTPITGFEKERYLGTWYEIARLDHPFERNLTHVRAEYSAEENGYVRVVNKGFDTIKRVWKSVEGRAKFISSSDVGSLKVSFFGPFYGGYHIIALDEEDYQYAMVAGPNRSYLWILAREKNLDGSTLSELISKAEAWGFKTEELIMVDHNLFDE